MEEIKVPSSADLLPASTPKWLEEFAQGTVRPWTYKDQTILAPMVRIGTLPMRLLAARYGCDMMYTEEIIDKKISKCKRVVNERNGTIEFVAENGAPPAFITCSGERVVFQVGTADAVGALTAAQVVANDVCAVDVNMGCPKHFSIQGGMGCALLSKPETVKDILSTLTRNLSIPVTCKIRLLDNRDRTRHLLQAIESSGVSAVAIHARHIEDRPRHRALTDEIPHVINQLNIPVIYNGDAFYYEDIGRLKAQTGAHSIMIARGAMWNPSIFRKEGMLPIYSVCSDYIELSEQVGNAYQNSKYAVMEMLKGHVGSEPGYQQVIRAKSFPQIRAALESMREHPSLIGDYECPFKPHHFQDRPTASSSDVAVQDGESKTALREAIDNNVNSNDGERKRKTKREKRKEKREINQLKRFRVGTVGQEQKEQQQQQPEPEEQKENEQPIVADSTPADVSS